MKGKYMAYVGSYSYNGQAKGITVYDVDVAKGRFIPRCEMEVDNSSYVIASNDGKTLYSIADEGVVSFRIHENGAITRLNSANIKGMRGCHLSTDAADKYIFVSGYHDGKSTVLRLNPQGTRQRGGEKFPAARKLYEKDSGWQIRYGGRFRDRSGKDLPVR